MALTSGHTAGNAGNVYDADQRLVVVTESATTVADGGNAPIKFAKISAASSGANTLVAAVASKKIRVLGYVLVAAGAVNVNFEDGTTDISGVMNLPANGGVSFAGGRVAPAFETTANTLLGLTLSAAVQVSGHLAYIEV